MLNPRGVSHHSSSARTSQIARRFLEDRIDWSQREASSTWSASGPIGTILSTVADNAPQPALEPIPEEQVRQVLPGYYDHKGRPLKYPPEVVEAALYEVAAHGGNVSKAVAALADRGINQAYPSHEGPALPRTVVREWVQRRFRNRYHEIVTSSVRELEEVVAQQGIDLALEMADAEKQALRQTTAGLADANAVEASQVLRNISQSKATQVDKALQLRGRGPADKVSKSLDEIAQGLKSLGLVVDSEAQEDLHDADVVDDDRLLTSG